MTKPPEILKELKIRGSKLSPEQLVEIIRKFCSESQNHDYMKEASEQYSLHISAPACDIHAVYREPFPLLAFAESNGGLYLTNIVPKTVSEIGISEYNSFLGEFAKEFRAYVKGRPEKIRILTTSGTLELEEIISSELARKRFLDFLNNYPLSRHPLDIERLDKFTLVLSSYSRKPLDLDLLRRYLVEVVGWEVKDARWCTDRIQTGLDVLNLRRRWYV